MRQVGPSQSSAHEPGRSVFLYSGMYFAFGSYTVNSRSGVVTTSCVTLVRGRAAAVEGLGIRECSLENRGQGSGGLGTPLGRGGEGGWAATDITTLPANVRA